MSLENLLQFHAVQFFIMVPGLMLAIAFLQSGWDKIRHRQGNLDWFKGHFAKTILGRWPAGALTYLTLLELGAGLSFLFFVLSFYGIFPALSLSFSIWIICNGMTLVSLFLGQRLAGDYAGAANINGYTLIYVLAGILQSILLLS